MWSKLLWTSRKLPTIYRYIDTFKSAGFSYQQQILIRLLPKIGDSSCFPRNEFGDLVLIGDFCIQEYMLFECNKVMIKGARRVGKSTIAEEFAKREYRSYIIVDFADAPEALWEAVDRISDRNNFFMQLQFIYGVKLYERESVIIFDEIQK